jgi:hypothetical protein
VRAYGGAACNAGTARHGSVLAHADVVPDLDQVIQLDAVFQYRVLQRAAVYAGVGSDFHVVANQHAAQLLDLDPLPLMKREAKTVGANHRTRMHNAALAEPAAVATVTRADSRVPSPIRACRPDDAMLRNTYAIANDSTLPYAGKCTNGDARRHGGPGSMKAVG